MTLEALYLLEAELLESAGLGADRTKLQGRPIIIIGTEVSTPRANTSIARGSVSGTAFIASTDCSVPRLLVFTTVSHLFGRQLHYLSYHWPTDRWTAHLSLNRFDGSPQTHEMTSVEFPAVTEPAEVTA